MAEVDPGAVTVVRRYGLGIPTFENPILPLGLKSPEYALSEKSLPTHELGIFETETDLR